MGVKPADTELGIYGNWELATGSRYIGGQEIMAW